MDIGSPLAVGKKPKAEDRSKDPWESGPPTCLPKLYRRAEVSAGMEVQSGGVSGSS
jgi:hypothetical protein